ncbi:hybrid sensor histidine kinase/response regulator [Burkholderia sp. LMU1-1-1.1]|uniref:hybrid sensor histidine kinase/response regulator n=1 Tax=Burkholderia sp. LMU1-1-1.1 TaxID=3135266 RepID=UPI00342F702E
MNDNAEPDTTAVSPVPPGRDGLYLQALHDKELADLRALIAQLLMQLESLQQQHDGAQTAERHVTQLREANAHLVLATFDAQDKQASAEASMRRQTDFLSMLAHELRNPLQPIAYASTLLAKMAGGDPELPRLHAIIERQMGHMTRLIDDLLDASRISSGKIGLDKTFLQLADIVALAAEGCQPRLDARRQQLRITQPGGKVSLYGDRVRLAQVFVNLLNNASKFSSEYEVIALEAQVVGNMVQIAVRDHGMGMAAELQPFIFDLFTQGLQSLDRAQGGLGIGLTLVRSLVEMQGGTVRAHSDGIGQGSVFTVLLPLSDDAAAPSAPAPPPLPSARQLRILLVEDNLDAAATLELLLQLGGHAVDQCHDGADGVEQALAGRYDLVICDIGLPGLDGFTVVERIRAGTTGAMPFFIATSGYNQPQDRARVIRSGFDHYLVKPVAIDMLLALIELHVH